MQQANQAKIEKRAAEREQALQAAAHVAEGGGARIEGGDGDDNDDLDLACPDGNDADYRRFCYKPHHCCRRNGNPANIYAQVAYHLGLPKLTARLNSVMAKLQGRRW